jgi:hypothetical protein
MMYPKGFQHNGPTNTDNLKVSMKSSPCGTGKLKGKSALSGVAWNIGTYTKRGK